MGRLGTFDLPRGFYLYVGSALGPGGLAARLGHHLRVAPKPRWHIDWLRRVATPVEVWWSEGAIRREHDWAARLAEIYRPAVPGFGASDCRCPTHLFRTPRRPDPGTLEVHAREA